jgi:hypothetical protein
MPEIKHESTGRLMEKTGLMQGTRYYRLNLDNYPPGVYQYSFYLDNGKQFNKRFVKMD